MNNGIKFEVCYTDKIYGVLDIISQDGTFLVVDLSTNRFKFIPITECIFKSYNCNKTKINA